ncbi:MAG: hypothetical protein ICV60_18185 [Pyrinomonadaceae bacterium]|nr:hypothetical protein [Pyrinomonadaceae bacterium]
MSASNPVAVIDHSKLVMARRRINIALATLEDGVFDLFTTENVVEILNKALSDLEEAHVVEQGVKYQVGSGIDWNAFERLTGGGGEGRV